MTKEKEIVGFLSVILHEDIVEECKDFATVWNVRAKYKRQGIATKMFRMVEEDLRKIGVDFLALIAVNTEESIAFYQSLGYEKENAYYKKLS